MALFKNMASSFANNIVPELIEQKFPKLSQLERDRKQNFQESAEVLNQLNAKFDKFKTNFQGISKIHTQALKQLKTGKFGTSKDDAERQMMESMGIDLSGFDELDKLDFGDSSSKESHSSNTDERGDISNSINNNTTINNVRASYIPESISTGDIVVSQSIAKQSKLNSLSAAINNNILNNISYQIGLMNAFHAEKTSAFYDLSVESYKNIIDFQTKLSENMSPMMAHFKRLEEENAERMHRKMMSNFGSGFDPKSILDPTRLLKKVNSSMALDDSSLGAVGGMVKGVIKDPIGFLATQASGALLHKFAGDLVSNIDRFAGNLPYIIQNKLQQMSLGRDYSKSEFHADNIFASIGDFLKADDKKAKVALNVDDGEHAEFDARTRRAIISEIPGYLSMMLTELKTLNGMFSSQFNIQPNKYIGHMLYDNEKGHFINSHTIEGSIKRDILNIRNGTQYGGVGSSVKAAATSAGVDKKHVTALSTMIGRVASTDAGAFLDVTDSDSIRKSVAAYAKANYRPIKTGKETNAEYQAKRDAHVQKLISAKFMNESVDKFTEYTKAAKSGKDINTEALRGTMTTEIDRLRGRAAERTEEESTRLKELEKEHKQMSKLDNGKVARKMFEDIEDGILKHRFTMSEEADMLSRRVAGSSKEKLGAINPELFNLKHINRVDTTGLKRKKPESEGGVGGTRGRGGFSFDGIGKVFGSFIDGLKSAFDGIGKFFQKGFDFVTGKINSIFSKLGKTFASFSGNISSFLKTNIFGLSKSAAEKPENSLWAVVKNSFNTNIFNPLKEMFLGHRKGAAAKMSLFDSIMFRWNDSITNPLKRFFLGTKDLTDNQLKKKSFLSTVYAGFDRTVMLPFKKLLVGDEKATKMGFFKALQVSWMTKIINPFKVWMLGDEKARRISFFKAIGMKWDSAILTPMKKWLLGTDDAYTLKKTSFFKSLSAAYNDKILVPMKQILMGKNASKEDAGKVSFFSTLVKRFDESILHPIKGFLFGEDNKSKSFFKNIYETFTPALNRILYGDDKAKQNSLWSNIKNSFKQFGSFITDRLLKPTQEWFVKELTPAFKDLFNEIKTEFKYYGGKLKTFFTKDLVKGAKGILNEIFGEKTIGTLQAKIVDPFKNAVNKLSDTLGGVLRFFMRIPVNFFKGIANTIRAARIKRGEGNYSEETKKELLEKEKSGKLFDFLDGVKKTASEKANVVKAGISATKGTPATTIMDSAKSTADAVGKTVITASEVVAKAAETTAANVNIVEGLKQAKDAIGDKWSNLLQATNVTISNFSSKIGNLFNRQPSDIVNAATHASTTTAATHTSTDSTKVEVATHQAAQEAHKASTATEKLLTFTSANMQHVGQNVKAILDKLSKVKGGGGGSFGSNPLAYIGAKLGNLLNLPLSLASNLLAGVSNALMKIASIPKKIIEATGSIIKTGLSTIAKIIPTLVSTASKLIETGLKGIAPIIDILAKTGVSVFNGLVNATGQLASSLGNALAPLMKAFVDLSATTLKALTPAFFALGKGVGHVTSGLTKFATTLLDIGFKIGDKLLSAFGAGAGRLFGFDWEKGGQKISINEKQVLTAKVNNFESLLSHSRSNPLYVYVVDGKIQTYRKDKKTIGFKDNLEGIRAPSLLPKDLKDKKKEEGSALGDLTKTGQSILSSAADAAILADGTLGAFGKLNRVAKKAGGWIAGKFGMRRGTSRGALLKDKFAHVTDRTALMREKLADNAKRVAGSTETKATKMQFRRVDTNKGALLKDKFAHVTDRTALMREKLADNAKRVAGSTETKATKMQFRRVGANLNETKLANSPEKVRINNTSGELTKKQARRLAAEKEMVNRNSVTGRMSDKVRTSLDGKGIRATEGGKGRIFNKIGQATRSGKFDETLAGKGINVAKKVASDIKGSKAAKVTVDAARTAGHGVMSVSRGAKSLIGRGLSAVSSVASHANVAGGNAITRGLGAVGRGTASVIKGAGSLIGKGASAVGGMFSSKGASSPTLMSKAGSVLGKAGSFLGKGLRAGGPLGLAAAVGGLITDQFTEKGSHANKTFGSFFDGAGKGALIGGMVGGPIGAALGAVVMGVVHSFTNARKWIEDTFEKEITGATKSFVEFPDKLAAWVDKLPEKINEFTETLPAKIVAWFNPPEESEFDPNTGLPLTDKPSILYKMFGALGRAGVTLLASAPKIAVTLLAGINKIVANLLLAAGGFIVKGAAKYGMMFADWIGDTLKDVMWAVKHPIDALRGKTRQSEMTDEERSKEKAERNKRNEDIAASIDAGTKQAGKSANAAIDKVSKTATRVTGMDALANAGRSNANTGNATAEKTFKSDEKMARDKQYQQFITERKLDPKAKSTQDQFLALEKMGKATKGNTGTGVFTPEQVKEAITIAATAQGIDPAYMMKIAMLESSMKYNADNGTAKGLFQFIKGTAKDYGIEGREFDPYVNADAAAKMMRKNMFTLQSNNIPINETTLYLAHQQGAAGLAGIWNAMSRNLPITSSAAVTRMSSNDPFGKRQMRSPKDFIAGWTAKINNTTMPTLGSQTTQVAGTNKGIGAGAGGVPIYANASPVATYARPTQVNPNKSAIIEAMAANTPAITEPNKAIAATSDGKVMSNTNAVANGGTMAQVAAAENVASNHAAASNISNALANNATKEDPSVSMLSELRNQTSILSAIAGNTKELHSVSDAVKVASATNNTSIDNSTKVVNANTNVGIRKASNMFSGMNGGDSDILRPSNAAMRVASGVNV